MPIEAAVWSLLMVISPGVAARLWPSLQERYQRLSINLEAWAPWIQSLGIPYLALILGSVSDRQMGLVGLKPAMWAVGGTACLIALAASRITLSRTAIKPDPGASASTVLLEEVRWGFYRGAAALWLSGYLASVLGLGLALLELAMTHMFIHGSQLPDLKTWKALLRAVLSTLLFVLTGNFWLTAGTQLLLTFMLRSSALTEDA